MELCILFFYHRCDDLTRSHLATLRVANPNAAIVPITDSVPELLPDSIDVSVFPSRWPTTIKWRSIDVTLYRWFENRNVEAKRYIVVEYDCLCNVDLCDYYSEVWDAEVAGVDFFTRRENPKWKWFMETEVNQFSPNDRKYAAGIVPFTCTMFSHKALEMLVASACTEDLFCELRLGSTVNKLGLTFQQLPTMKRSTIAWHLYPWQANRPGLFHCIKALDHNVDRPRQPGTFRSRCYELLRGLIYDRELLPFYLKGKRERIKRLLSL